MEAALRIPRKFKDGYHTIATVNDGECRTLLAYKVAINAPVSDQPVCGRPTERGETVCPDHIRIFTQKGVSNRRKAQREPRRLSYRK